MSSQRPSERFRDGPRDEAGGARRGGASAGEPNRRSRSWVCRTGSDHLAKLQRTLAESEEQWRNELRLEGATISRKSIVVTFDEDERATLPMPEARPPSDPGMRASRDPIDALRAAIEKGRGSESSARVRAAREARDAAETSERAGRRAARDADEPSERGARGARRGRAE